MRMPADLLQGTLLRRYKRFLADVRLPDGETVTAHCPNSGSMKGCNTPGSPVLLSRSENPRRKLAFTWEMIRIGRVWVGVNTHTTNLLAREGIEKGVVEELQGYASLRREVRFGANSRLDFLLTGATGRCYVEVKNVTLVEGGVARFPDAVTLRGQKHLDELVRARRMGHRAAMLFVVQRGDARAVAPADDIDPAYGAGLRRAVRSGVEALAYRARVTRKEIALRRRLPVLLTPPVAA